MKESLLAQLKHFLENKGIFINSSNHVGDDVFMEEFFLKRIGGKFFVGFDRYNEKFEDATDLYESYIREDFDNLTSAVNFITLNLPITVEQLSHAAIGRRK